MEELKKEEELPFESNVVINLRNKAQDLIVREILKGAEKVKEITKERDNLERKVIRLWNILSSKQQCAVCPLEGGEECKLGCVAGFKLFMAQPEEPIEEGEEL